MVTLLINDQFISPFISVFFISIFFSGFRIQDLNIFWHIYPYVLHFDVKFAPIFHIQFHKVDMMTWI